MYGGVLHDGMMASVLETHYVEAKEFLFHAGIVPWLLFAGIFTVLFGLTKYIKNRTRWHSRADYTSAVSDAESGCTVMVEFADKRSI